MQSVQSSTKVNFCGKVYDVAYPTVGQKLKIENNKILLTNGQYGDFVRSGHKTALRYLDLVDAFSYLSVLLPDDTGLTLDKFENMDMNMEMAVRKAYSEDYFPYWSSIEEMFNKEYKNASTEKQ